jgi:6-pyruvoyltetrahydropterin/6-carboxytetrahydropterin synthase
MNTTISRYHEIDCGHRVVGHEGKCRNLHGHRYRFTFTCTADALDGIGRIIDFSQIKTVLCQWLEDNWDHRFLMWEHDPFLPLVQEHEGASLVVLPFNPTAENLAAFLFDFAKTAMAPYGIAVVGLECEETAKCSAYTHG